MSCLGTASLKTCTLPMTTRICRCGRIVGDKCEKCDVNAKHASPTAVRGYDSQHRAASQRYRQEKPLCERCVMVYGVMQSLPSAEMHHIRSIKSRPELRMDSDNWLALCRPHHEELENKIDVGIKTKMWSKQNYEKELGK